MECSPIPFEVEFPLEGKTLIDVCQSNAASLKKDRTIVDFDAGTIRKSTVRNTTTLPGRNDPCNCGSGVKFKKCCMGK